MYKIISTHVTSFDYHQNPRCRYGVLGLRGHPGSYKGYEMEPKLEPRLPDSQATSLSITALLLQAYSSVNQLDCARVFNQTG